MSNIINIEEYFKRNEIMSPEEKEISKYRKIIMEKKIFPEGCVACSATEFQMEVYYLHLPIFFLDRKLQKNDPFLPILPITCLNCGYISFFSKIQLERCKKNKDIL